MMSGLGTPYQQKSLLESYVDRYSDTLAHRRASLKAHAAKIEAELAYKARGEFLANMNHELRTPLNAIVGFAQMLKEAKSYGLSDEQTTEYLDYILNSADLLLGHINTILELAAAESGGAKMSRREVGVHELVAGAVEQHQALAEAAGVVLDSSVDDGLPALNVDPDKIDTALHHLIENAITYCEEGGEVSVLARPGRRINGHDWVYIAVEDTGEGMTPEELDRAMRAFEQAHQGLHRKYDGTGLGLPIAKSFIELNGGRFDIKSQKGVGTKVRFALPAFDMKEQAETPAEEETRKSA
jgi:two-component system cell cycle sensor histidine kinase PleC